MERGISPLSIYPIIIYYDLYNSFKTYIEGNENGNRNKRRTKRNI